MAACYEVTAGKWAATSRAYWAPVGWGRKSRTARQKLGGFGRRATHEETGQRGGSPRHTVALISTASDVSTKRGHGAVANITNFWRSNGHVSPCTHSVCMTAKGSGYWTDNCVCSAVLSPCRYLPDARRYKNQGYSSTKETQASGRDHSLGGWLVRLDPIGLPGSSPQATSLFGSGYRRGCDAETWH